MKRFEIHRRMRTRGAWRRALCSVGLITLGLAMAPAAHAQAQTIAFDIESQPLSSALLSFGRQAGLSVLAPSNLVEGKVAPEVRGEFSVAAALERLLAGSSLKFEFVQTNAVRIVARDKAGVQPDLLPATEDMRDSADVDRIVVTGTSISGVYPASSPVEIYTTADIERSGAATTEEFVRRLPQNVGTLSPYAAGATTGAPNLDSVSSIDLRGLGVGTTLTLLNGHRMAPSNSGQSVDVSLIPASAIARVEVLTDGASAIYGSDAIGGVVNFVLRDDFEGAETRLSYGGVTSGGMRRGSVSQTLGWGWEGGHGLVAYNYQSASALKRTDRSYAAGAGPGYLSPVEESHTLLGAFKQSLSDRLDVNADFVFGRRDVKNASSSLVNVSFAAQSRGTYRSATDLAQGSLVLDYRVTDRLNAQLSASYSEIDVDGKRYTLRFNRIPQQLLTTDFSTNSSALDVMAKLDGALLSLPGGDLRFSIGGGVLEEEFKGIRPVTLVQSKTQLGRRSPYAFAELFAPLIGPGQAIPLVRRLELSLAARYSDYQDKSSPPLDRDFGDSSDPKAGLLWSPFESLSFRATYGTSFRAPALTQLDPTSNGFTLSPATLAGAPGIVLSLGPFAAPDVGPERAETYTAGFDFSPSAAPGFRLSGTYYNIDYTDRIAIAPAGTINVFQFPQLVPDLIYRPPSVAFIQEQLLATPLLLNSTAINLSDPNAAAQELFQTPNFWIFDSRFKNLALSRQDGFDLTASQDFSTAWGDVRIGANTTRILAYKQQATSTSTVLTAVDAPGRPPHWRGRAFANLSRGSLNGTLSVNYTGGYANSFATGAPDVDSWTTVDLNVAYGFEEGLFKDARLSLSVQNLFDRDPPRLDMGAGNAIVSPVGFDPVNANPMGRIIVLGLSKKW